jgi:zinc/manganese transport system substrate-binding protein
MITLKPIRIAAAILAAAAASPAKVKVAASLPDLASIAAYVGGDEAEVFSIAKANSNPHFVEVLPSYMIKVSRAAVYLKAGLALDQWADAIIEGARNPKLIVEDCSGGITVLDKPSGKVDASMGDAHPQGNPHYWLDPANGPLIAARVREALAKADPKHAELFAANEKRFGEECARRNRDWHARLAPLQGTAIVTYHSSWAYFAKAFGLRVVGFVEPFPGIPPTAKHLQELTQTIQAEKARILIQEPYYGDSDPQFLARRTGIQVYRFTPSCEGTGADDYLKHFDVIAAGLAGAGAPGTGG